MSQETDGDLVSMFNAVRVELFSALALMLANHADALDALQAAFLDCWQAREGVAGVHNLRAWICRVALNAAKNLRRWRFRAAGIRCTGRATNFGAPPRPETLGTVTFAERSVAVRGFVACIAHTPPLKSQVLSLHVFRTAYRGRKQ